MAGNSPAALAEFSGRDEGEFRTKYFVFLTAKIYRHSLGTGGVTSDVFSHRPDKGRQVAGQVGIATAGDRRYSPQGIPLSGFPGVGFELDVT